MNYILCFRNVCFAFSIEKDYSVSTGVSNIFGSSSENIAVFVETPIKNFTCEINPNLNVDLPSEFLVNFEENFVKGNLFVDFGDGLNHTEFYMQKKSISSAQIYHKYVY